MIYDDFNAPIGCGFDRIIFHFLHKNIRHFLCLLFTLALNPSAIIELLNRDSSSYEFESPLCKLIVPWFHSVNYLRYLRFTFAFSSSFLRVLN